MSVNVSNICGIMITSRSERKELFGCDIFTISSPTVSVVKGRSGDRSSFSLIYSIQCVLVLFFLLK